MVEGVTVRTKAALRETSLVTFPAYAGALVAGVRLVVRRAGVVLGLDVAGVVDRVGPGVDWPQPRWSNRMMR